MLKKKKDIENKLFIIVILFLILVSTIYSLIIGRGHYGFGVDYYHAYQFSYPSDVFFTDRIGWFLSTLNINGFKIGVFTLAFLIPFSTGIVLLVFFNKLNLKNTLFFFIIFIALIHSWPVFPSIINAMRQGAMMSFIFLGLYFLNNSKISYSFLFFLIALFTHKSGIFFFSIFLILVTFKLYKKNTKNLVNLYFVFGITSFFFSLIIFYILDYLQLILISQYNRIIGRDFSEIFLVINILYILYFSKFNKFLLKNYFNFYIYLFSFFILGCYFIGLIWQYERLNMIMLIPYILSVGNCFSKSSKTTYAFIVISLLFILTLYTGMFELGVGIY